jgi:hypothetical protein
MFVIKYWTQNRGLAIRSPLHHSQHFEAKECYGEGVCNLLAKTVEHRDHPISSLRFYFSSKKGGVTFDK